MARKAYIGVDGMARRVKKGYIGAPADRSGLVRSAADTLLYTYGGRNYKKALNGDAVCASVVANGWLCPLLVAKTADAVAYKTDGNYESEQYSQNTFTYKGETWHVSTTGAAYQTSNDPGGAVPHLNSITGKTYATIPEAAADLLDYYTMVSEARRIIRAYIGVGGVARPCWNMGLPTYYGTITPAQAARTNVGCAKVGKYAVYAGGEAVSGGSYTFFNAVDAYDSGYTHYIPASLSSARGRLAGASVGGYALFGGGINSNALTTVDAYDENLTRTTATALSTARYLLAAGSIGNYAVFNGGVADTTYYSVTNAYDADLTRSVITASSSAHSNHCGGRTKNHLLFPAGYNGYHAYTTSVDAYDASLTRTAGTAMSTKRTHFPSAEAGDYVLFAGGMTSVDSVATNGVDAYDDTLTKTSAPVLHVAKHSVGGGSLNGYALFAGGYDMSKTVANAEAYDKNLVKTTIGSLTNANSILASVTLDDSAIFYSNGTMEVYCLM